ncbi:MAG TPA: phosphate/phosphite/phosphonate ABC transporter substrate-binding protein [Vicinamibacterales bacterium]|nr:phosphate/phosphite/phosphonate ABC transporter substrate-binding protein [Vicinamibacterales bacterium]
MIRAHVGLCTILAAGLVAGCTTRASTVTDTTARPKIFRYAYSPGSEEAETLTLRIDKLKTYLASQLHVEVEMYKTSAGYGPVIEAMRAKKVDAAGIGPFGYLIASEKAGAEVIAMRGTRNGDPGEYGGVIAVGRNSRIKTIEDLVAHSKELTFSFVDPASTSGFLVQRAYFQSVGLDPDRDFKKTLFSVNHPASALTLKAGKVDAAAMMEPEPGNIMYRRLFDKGRMKEGDLRILWRSPRLPASPIVVRKDLPDAFKKEIQAAFVEMAERDPELWKIWPRSGGDPTQTKMLPATDAMFDGLRAMARNVKNLSLLEH